MAIRRIWTTTRLQEYLDWPGVAPVCLWERLRRRRGQATIETVCAITSLGPERASASRLLTRARGPGEIEKRLPWVRDVRFGEDGGRVRSGEAPQVLAALRHTVLWLMRSRGLTAIAAALRRHAAKPFEALHLVMDYTPS